MTYSDEYVNELTRKIHSQGVVIKDLTTEIETQKMKLEDLIESLAKEIERLTKENALHLEGIGNLVAQITDLKAALDWIKTNYSCEFECDSCESVLCVKKVAENPSILKPE